LARPAAAPRSLPEPSRGVPRRPRKRSQAVRAPGNSPATPPPVAPVAEPPPALATPAAASGKAASVAATVVGIGIAIWLGVAIVGRPRPPDAPLPLPSGPSHSKIDPKAIEDLLGPPRPPSQPLVTDPDSPPPQPSVTAPDPPPSPTRWLDPGSEHRRRRFFAIKSLSDGGIWPVPSFVAREVEGRTLLLVDATPSGRLALYRAPCTVRNLIQGRPGNCAYSARLYGLEGKPLWDVALNPFFLRPAGLEVDDIRLDDGVLYFNEACRDDAPTVLGLCSSVVAVDPQSRRLLWRSKTLISRGPLAISATYIVSGASFGGTPAQVFLMRRSDGVVLTQTTVPAAPTKLRIDDGGTIHVTTAAGNETHLVVQVGAAGVPVLLRQR
jgi:hypothetical protein